MFNKYNLSQSVYEQLKQEIISGEICQGEKISESALAEKYQTSRGPLREALNKLEAIKLIIKTPNSKSEVVTLNEKLLSDVYQMRELFEGAATRLAAQHMTEEDIDNLYTLLDKHSQSVQKEQGKSYFQQEGDLDFHFFIFSKCGNTLLSSYLQDELYQIIRMCRYQTAHMSLRVSHALAEHYQIADAIKKRDGEFAEILMRRHISGAWNDMKQLLITQLPTRRHHESR